MNKKVLFIFLFGLFVILNLIPTYGWLWGMSFVDLERPEYSTIAVNMRDNLNFVLRAILILGLWLPILIVIIKKRWKVKALILPYSISLSLFLVMYVGQDVYPDEYSEFTEEGYQYKIEKWRKGDLLEVKRWRSKDSLKNHLTHRHIEWELIKKEIKN